MRLLVCFMAATALFAQEGASIFRQTCAQGYCHGAGGSQGRAPKLIGRAFDPTVALKIISDGVSGTGMPGFKDRLNATEMNAVLDYVVKISGGDASKLPSATNTSVANNMPAAAQKGRELFFDAARGVNRCGTCHALDGMGVAIGPNLVSGSHYDAAAIRRGRPSAVQQVTAKGETFPALLLDRNVKTIRVYDLGAVPPPLRTFAASGVTFGPAAGWSHANGIRNYSTSDLETISAWLDRLSH